MEKNILKRSIVVRYRWVAIAVIALVLSACQSATSEEVEVTRQVTVEVSVVEEVEVTRLVEVEVEKEIEVTREVVVEVTKLVEVTAMPEPTTTPLPQGENPNVFALNYLGQVESGGLEVEVLRVFVSPVSDMNADFQGAMKELDAFDGVDVVSLIAFRLLNNTDQKLSVYPDQGTIQINSEQIEIFEFTWGSEIGDDLGGDIFPGAEKVGAFWFGINRNQPSEITSMIIRFDGPRDEDFSRTGPDFELILNLEDHRFDEIPAELANLN
jgi:hypothetical protein